MADNKQHDTRTARRPDCVTEIRMGNSVLVVSGYFKKIELHGVRPVKHIGVIGKA